MQRMQASSVMFCKAIDYAFEKPSPGLGHPHFKSYKSAFYEQMFPRPPPPPQAVPVSTPSSLGGLSGGTPTNSAFPFSTLTSPAPRSEAGSSTAVNPFPFRLRPGPPNQHLRIGIVQHRSFIVRRSRWSPIDISPNTTRRSSQIYKSGVELREQLVGPRPIRKRYY